MKNQIFISLLIIAVLNYLTGCMTTYKLTPAELSFSEDHIRQVVLINLNTIEFTANSGLYEKLPDLITGQLLNGSKANILVDQVKELRTSKAEPVALENLKGAKITEIVLDDNKIVIFDEQGGSYDPESNIVSGRTADDVKRSVRTKVINSVYTTRPDIISPEKLIDSSDVKIKQVVTKSNVILNFDENGGRYIFNKPRISGINREGERLSIGLDSVLYVNIVKTDGGATLLAVLGIIVVVVVGIGLIIAATKNSCPFVYSYDGERYVFDAEPLGGATTKGMERTEYSSLDYLKSVNGYKLLVRNEVEETQYIDELLLMYLIHDQDKVVVPDLDGNFYQIKSPALPVSAADENGMDLKNAVSIDDDLYWQTKLPLDTSIYQGTRHELTFNFIKPAGITNAKLVANVGTSLWGSRMIREMLQLYGNSVDSYYESIDKKGADYERTMNFIETEELYKLKYYVKDGENWNFQGFINGGGPLISETRVYNLDLTGIEEDTITIKVNPPYGFWTVDYLAIEYENYDPPVIMNLFAESAIDRHAIDVCELIKTRDNIYCIMPEVGDFFEASFPEPNIPSNYKASFYLKSTGYYEIHLDKTTAPEIPTLIKFISDEGYIIKYSDNRFREWIKSGK